jgi:hypothetical protein
MIMGFLTREQIIGAEATDDREFDVVPCPEWGGDVRLSSISGRARDEYEQSLIEQRGNDRRMNLRNARAKLIVLTAVDESGSKLFTPEDLAALGRKNAKPLDRLFTAAQKLAGLNDDDVTRLTENFGATPDDASSSD